MDDQGIYLYCFARSGPLDHFDAVGVDGRTEIEALALRDVNAVFSTISLAEFQGERAQSNLQSADWLIPRACRHERVIEQVMSRSPVLPIRFGAIFSSPEALHDRMLGHCDEIRRFLDHMSDKSEWSIKAFLHSDRATEWLLAHDWGLVLQRDRLPDAPGARYFQEKRLRVEAEKLARSRIQTAVGSMQGALQAAAVDCRALKLCGSKTGGWEMVLNLAIMLRNDQVPDCQTRIDGATVEYCESGLVWEMSGPWPPFHFCPSLSSAPEANYETSCVLYSS